MNEQQPHTQPIEGMPQAEQQEQQRYKTLAVRLEEGTHARLRFIAQLSGSSIAEEIRGAIEARISAAQDDPDLVARADRVRQEIEREAATRAAAIAGFLGTSAVGTTAEVPAATTSGSATRARRTSKPRAEQGK